MAIKDSWRAKTAAAFVLGWIALISLFSTGVTATTTPSSHFIGDNSVIDVEEGDNVKLQCRFAPGLAGKDTTLYWIRTNRFKHDNVAIGSTPFQENYGVDHRPEEGIYDLTLSSANYDRDNGRFECRMKEGGSGQELHSMAVELTVLLRPSPPTITPSGSPTGTEGRPLNLTCSSVGGSPPPKIQWYRMEDNLNLDFQYIPGANKDQPTKAILTIIPTKEDDGSSYKCTVWNRAMKKDDQFQQTAKIFVNYFPRVTVGPENPLRVEVDDTAQLACQVDAKPSVNSVKWIRNDRFIDTHFKHTIPRVKLEDAGSYVCSADNGLGQVGKAELQLDVLHAPIVTLPESREAKAGESVSIECQVTANPRPTLIQWYKEGDNDFVQTGAVLRLQKISADHNGRYICAATNYLQPSGGEKVMRVGNATIDIHVRHRPGQAFITPDRPIGVEGRSITMRCGANPPGFPRPTYNWWKEDGGNDKILAVGSEFTIDSVRMNNAGRYFCQPVNDLGDGSVARVNLEVYQAPKIITQLQPNIMKRAGDTGFHITCSAMGKPKPQVRWFKDGEEIVENELFQIATSEQEAIPNRGYNVLSTLKYTGPDRIGDNQLMPTDRGHYTCQFENEVSRSVTTMLLRIEHSPVVVHRHNKVAFDVGETGFISCQMQAFPSPRFDWSFGNTILQSDRRNYETSLTELDNDVYEGILQINRVTESSYGDYICKASNSMGAKRTIIKLQPKGKPTEPTSVRALEASYDYITLAWDNGFDGGYNNTMFTVQYKKRGESSPRYHDCRYNNPCNITGLDQHTQYNVRVKASNIRGESPFSREVAVTTKVDVDLIPSADNLHYAKTTKQATFNIVNDNYLPLVAQVELENPDGSWSHFDELPMDSSASYGQMDIGEENVVRNLRVRLCLETNQELCGPFAEARIVDVSPVLSSGESTAPWLIGVIILAVVICIMVAIVVIKCFCCKQAKGSKSNVNRKGRPSIVHSGPPPYTSGYGIENKGVDTVKDDNLKGNNLYSVQNGYEQYNNEHQSNSNSNSANGGSVNSQDSLWNVKGHPHNNMELHYQNTYMHPDVYQYDPQMMQQQHGYMPQQPEDYAHYPYPDEYLNERNQQFLMNADQAYGQVPNNARQQMEGDYTQFGDMSGLPDPYVNQVPHQNNYEEEPDEGEFSPNGRGRRVIREIIV